MKHLLNIEYGVIFSFTYWTQYQFGSVCFKTMPFTYKMEHFLKYLFHSWLQFPVIWILFGNNFNKFSCKAHIMRTFKCSFYVVASIAAQLKRSILAPRIGNTTPQEKKNIHIYIKIKQQCQFLNCTGSTQCFSLGLLSLSQ